MPDPEPPCCRICCAAAGSPVAPAWARERDDDGRDRWLCPGCARRHVREIEAKLPAEWW